MPINSLKNMKLIKSLRIAFFALCGVAARTHATPQVIRVQGNLFNASGAPYTGSKDLQIKAYDASTSGTLLWTSATTTTTVVDGHFDFTLDASSGSPTLLEQIGLLGDSATLYFEIVYDAGAANGAMNTPVAALRMRAKGSAFALSAKAADTLTGVTATVAQLNSLVGVTANLQTQINSLSSLSNSLLRAAAITSSARALPTSGNLSGTYLQLGGVTSTGAYTVATGTRVYLKGDLVIGHNVTVSGVTVGGQSTFGSSAYGNAQRGGGPAGGDIPEGYSAGGGGGGGTFGGEGGHGGSYLGNAWGWGGRVLGWENAWMGSGGGSGYGYSTSDNPGDGGDAGGVVYIECTGNVTITGSSAWAANGGAGGAAGTAANVYVGGGGGGSGGGFMIRADGAITIASGASLSANGGAGGNGYSYGGGGGGGGGGVVALWAGSAITNSGTINISGGAKGNGGGSHTAEATAGLTGVTSFISNTTPISFY